jgi:hypothetical protein
MILTMKAYNSILKTLKNCHQNNPQNIRFKTQMTNINKFKAQKRIR